MHTAEMTHRIASSQGCLDIIDEGLNIYAAREGTEQDHLNFKSNLTQREKNEH